MNVHQPLLITNQFCRMSSIEHKVLWKRKIEGKCNLQLFRDIVNRKYGLALSKS